MVIVGVIIIALIVALAIQFHHQQKLDACGKMIDNAARIICISDQ